MKTRKKMKNFDNKSLELVGGLNSNEKIYI